MKKYLFALCAFLVISLSNMTYAQDTYATAYVGFGTQGTYGSVSGGVNVGAYSGNFSLEVDYHAMSAVATTGDLRAADGMNVMPVSVGSLKLKAHTSPDYPFNFYIGGGVGLGWLGEKYYDCYNSYYDNYYYNDYYSYSYNSRPWMFTFSANAGFDIQMSDDMALNVEANGYYMAGYGSYKRPGYYATVTVGLKFKM